MKKILILTILLAIGYVNSYSQSNVEKEKTYVLNAQRVYSSGSAELAPETADQLHMNLLRLFSQLTDSLNIQTIVETSTDKVPVGAALAKKLYDSGYTGDNEGLSRLRNDEASKIVDLVLKDLKSSKYKNKTYQIINHETGDGINNRYVKIKFNISLFPNEIDYCDSLRQELAIFSSRGSIRMKMGILQDSLTSTHGDRNRLTLDEYKAFKKYLRENEYENKEHFLVEYVNENIQDISYLHTQTDFLKLSHNTAKYWNKKFVKQSAVGVGVMAVGAFAIIKGVDYHPVYIHHYTDGELDNVEDNLEYYDGTNHRAKRVERKRKTWIGIGSVVAAVGTVIVIDAWKYHKFAVEIGSPDGIINLKYNW